MSVLDLIHDIIIPDDVGEVRPDSPRFSPVKKVSNKSFSPSSPVSPQVDTENTKTKRAAGYCCRRCGCRTYHQVEEWETIELPESEPWKHEHRSAQHWQCAGCEATYHIIGGTKGPQYLN